MVTESPCAVLRCWRLRVEKNTSIREGSNRGSGGLSRSSCAIPSSEGECTWNGGHDRNNSDFNSCRSSGEAPFSECTDGDTRRTRNECESSSGDCNVASLSNNTPSNDDSSSKAECINSIVSVGHSENDGTKEEKVDMQSKTASSQEVDHDKFMKKNCNIELRKEKQVGLFRDDYMIVTLVEMNDLAANPKAYLWIGERVHESTTALATHPSTIDELSRRISQRCSSQVHQDLPIEITIVYQSQEPQDMLRTFNTCKGGWGGLFICERVSTSPYRVIELVEKQGVAVAYERIRKDRIGVISKGRTRTSSQIIIPSKMKSYVVVQGSRPIYMWHSSEESTSVECLGRCICENAAYLLHQQNDVPSSSSKEKRGKKSKRKKPSLELFHFWGGDASTSPPPPKLFWEAMGLEEEGGFPVDKSYLPTTLSARDCIDVANDSISHHTHTEVAPHGKTSKHQQFQDNTGNEEDPQGNVASCKIEGVSHPGNCRGSQQPRTLENVMGNNMENAGEVKKSSTMDVVNELSLKHVSPRNGSNPDIRVVDDEGTQYQRTLDEYVVDDYVDIISSKSVMVDVVDSKRKQILACKREILTDTTIECEVVDDGIINVVSNVECQVVDGAAIATLDNSLQSYDDDADVTERCSASKTVQNSGVVIETTEVVDSKKTVMNAIDMDGGISVNVANSKEDQLLTAPNEVRYKTNIGCFTDTTIVGGQRGKLGIISAVEDGVRRRSSSLSLFILDELGGSSTDGVKLNEINQLSPQPSRCEGKRGTESVLVKDQQVDTSSEATAPQHCDELGRHHFLLDVVKHPCLLDVSKCKAFNPNVHNIKEVEPYNTMVNGVSEALSFESVSRTWNAGEVLLLQSSVNTVTEPEHEIGKVISQDSVDNAVGIMNEEEQQRTQDADCDNKSAVTTLVNASKGQVETTIHRPMQDDDRDKNEVTVRVHNTPPSASKKSSTMTNKTNVKYNDDCCIVRKILDPISNSPEARKMPRRGSNSAVEKARALADIDRFRREEQRVLNANGFMDQVQNLAASIICGGGEGGSFAKEYRERSTTANQNRQTLSRRGSAANESSTILDIRSDSTPVKSTTTLSRLSSAVYHSPAPTTPTAIDLNCGDMKPTIWETWNPGRSDLKAPLPAMLPEIPGSFELFLDWHKICCTQDFG
eukprot:143331_1